MRGRKRAALAIIVSFGLFGYTMTDISPAMPVYASEAAAGIDKSKEDAARQQIDEIQRQQDENNANANNARDRLSNAWNEKNAAEAGRNALAEEAGTIQGQVNSLTRNLSALTAEIGDIETSIAGVEAEIEELENELSEANAKKQEEYDYIKARLAYLYENDTRGTMLTSLFTSGSMSEFLQRMEYINAMVAYDDDLLTKYNDIVSDIEKKSGELSAKQEELEGQRGELSAKQGEVNELVASASQSLRDKNIEVSAADEQISAINDQIGSYEAELAVYEERRVALEAAAAQAQANLAQAIAEQQQAMIDAGLVENTSGAVIASASDVVLLAATIQAEADNQPYEGKLAVASVILNRVNSSLFPTQNSIAAVITAPGQFASYSSGKVALIVERGPNETCMAVAQAAIDGARNGNWLFFMTQPWADHFGITGYVPIADHVFFYKWGAN